MGYKMNIRGSSTWNNLFKDANIEITDTGNKFTSTTLEGVLDELYTIATSGGISWSVVVMDTTTLSNHGYFVNTSGGIVVMTLPSSASVGDTVKISDVSGTFGTYKCTIARNGNKIMGLSEDFDCDINNLCIELVYSNSTNGWRITNFTY